MGGGLFGYVVLSRFLASTASTRPRPRPPSRPGDRFRLAALSAALRVGLPPHHAALTLNLSSRADVRPALGHIRPT
jgi:hypothetical protein